MNSKSQLTSGIQNQIDGVTWAINNAEKTEVILKEAEILPNDSKKSPVLSIQHSVKKWVYGHSDMITIIERCIVVT